MLRPIASALLSCLALGFAGCTPKKEPTIPPAPKVAAPVAALPVIGPAPVWELKDVDGQVVRSRDFTGKIVVVDFWATWCAPCKEEIPGYIELVKKYGAAGLVIVGVSVDQAGAEAVKTFAKKNGMNYPVVMFDDNVIAAFGGVEAIPTTFLIDRAGQIRDRKVGAEPTAEYEKKIVALLH